MRALRETELLYTFLFFCIFHFVFNTLIAYVKIYVLMESPLKTYSFSRTEYYTNKIVTPTTIMRNRYKCAFKCT